MRSTRAVAAVERLKTRSENPAYAMIISGGSWLYLVQSPIALLLYGLGIASIVVPYIMQRRKVPVPHPAFPLPGPAAPRLPGDVSEDAE